MQSNEISPRFESCRVRQPSLTRANETVSYGCPVEHLRVHVNVVSTFRGGAAPSRHARPPTSFPAPVAPQLMLYFCFGMNRS
jgi:hypothetical protein